MMTGMYYDRQGNELTLDAWGVLHGQIDYKRVASDRVGPFWVSTVWLGMDHGWDGNPPIIFESMIFHDDEGFSERECRRYCTEEEALEGHRELLATLQYEITEESLT